MSYWTWSKVAMVDATGVRSPWHELLDVVQGGDGGRDRSPGVAITLDVVRSHGLWITNRTWDGVAITLDVVRSHGLWITNRTWDGVAITLDVVRSFCRGVEHGG